ncbi:hypothetical protein F503_00168 [Ophiostoma piceae UAMH 11346]|uniref:RanGTP-binding protein n=1 Tax=Ophiostoma piceae (strain UAMH 11346) TaxID=1262450 RepID=S3BUT9_OPHP1|nr:hypothetical protein F503_00168 [Ophiostoma piceae UAMH 11346]
MDEFLARLGMQAMNYAMRCGIALTSTFALQQCSRLLKTVDDKSQYSELHALQTVLDTKIKIISPALDLIEFKSGRGNAFLGNAAVLAKALHRDIIALGKRLEKAAGEEEMAQTHSGCIVSTKDQRQAEIVDVIRDIKSLLARIDGDIPLLQLAITASGESLSTSLPPSISPSRLLQASMLLVIGDTQFSGNPSKAVQIGPSFTLSLYMLFRGHSTTLPNTAGIVDVEGKHSRQPYGIGDGERKPIWQEVLHKTRVRICRTLPDWVFTHEHGYTPIEACAATANLESEFAYHLEIIEDLDDGRVHDDKGDDHTAYDGMPRVGVQESIPMHQIAKLFYTDSGRILNIGNTNEYESSSVLLLKRDTAASPPKKTLEHLLANSFIDNDSGSGSEASGVVQNAINKQLMEEIRGLEILGDSNGELDLGNGFYKLPLHLDPEWLALEVFSDEIVKKIAQDDTDGESGVESDEEGCQQNDDGESPTVQEEPSVDTHLAEQMHNISLTDTQDSSPNPAKTAPSFGTVMSSLSLLEMLIRLTSLQEFQQTSHLSIPDHILTFFLEETSTTGLCGEARWKAKQAAKHRMGFDPFTDTPTK